MFVPLSTGEEQFLRLEDAQRRRKQRLIEVRLQEKRIAQERAQWYKAQVKETLDKKRTARLQEAEAEKAVAMSSLHAKYTASMNAIGDAHALAAEFNSNLQMRAKRQLEALAYNDNVEDHRFLSAVGDAHEEARRRGARERIARENMAKIQEIASRQRAHAKKVHHRKVERDERERQDRDAMASAVEARLEHTIVPPARPHAVHLHESLLRHSRLHAMTHTTKSSMKTSRILRHNFHHATAMDAWNEGRRKRQEVDQAGHARFLAAKAHAADAHDRGAAAERRVADGAEAKAALRWLEDAGRMFAQQTTDRQRDLHFTMNQAAHERGSHERATESAFEAMFRPPGDQVQDEQPRPQVHRWAGDDAPRPLPPVTPVAAPAGVSRHIPPRQERLLPSRRRPPPTVPSALYYSRMDSPTDRRSERPVARWPVMAMSASSSGGDVDEDDNLGHAASDQTDAPPRACVDEIAAPSKETGRVDEINQPTAKPTDQEAYDDGQWDAASPHGSVWSSPRRCHSLQTTVFPAEEDDDDDEMRSPRPQSPAPVKDPVSSDAESSSHVVEAPSTTPAIEPSPPPEPAVSLAAPPPQHTSHQESSTGAASSSPLSSCRSRTALSRKNDSIDSSHDGVDVTLSTPFVTTTSMDASVDPSTLDSIDGPAQSRSPPTTEQPAAASDHPGASPTTTNLSASTLEQSETRAPPARDGPPLARTSFSSSDASLLARSRHHQAPPSASSSSSSDAPAAATHRAPTVPSSADETEAGPPDWKSDSFHITFDSAAIALERPHPALRDEFYGLDAPASPVRSSLLHHSGRHSPTSDRDDQDDRADALPCFDLNSSAFSSEDHWAPSLRPPHNLDGEFSSTSAPSRPGPALRRFRLSSSGSSSSSSCSTYAPSTQRHAVSTSPRSAHQRNRQRLLDLVGSSSSSSSSSSVAPDDNDDDVDIQMQTTLRHIQEQVRDMTASGELPSRQETTHVDKDTAPPSPPPPRGGPSDAASITSWDAESDGGRDLPPLDNVDLSMDLSSSIGSSSPLSSSASWKRLSGRHRLGHVDTSVDAPLVLQWMEYAPRGSPTVADPASYVHRLGGHANDDEDGAVLSTHSLRSHPSTTSTTHLQSARQRNLDVDRAELASSHGVAFRESSQQDVELVEGKRSAPKSTRSSSTGSSVEDLARAIAYDREGGGGMNGRPTAAAATSSSHKQLSPSGSSSSSPPSASLAAQSPQTQVSSGESPTGGHSASTAFTQPTASPLSHPPTAQDGKTSPSRPAAMSPPPTTQLHADTSPARTSWNDERADKPLEDGTRTSHSSDDRYLTRQSIADPSDGPPVRQDQPPPPASAHPSAPSNSSGTPPPSASPSSSAASGGRVNIAEEVVLVPHDAAADASPQPPPSAAADRHVGGASAVSHHPHPTSHIVASEWRVEFAAPFDDPSGPLDPPAVSIGAAMDSIAAVTSPPPPPSSRAYHPSTASSADERIAERRSSRDVVYPPHTTLDQLPPWATSASRQHHAGLSIRPWPHHDLDASDEDDDDVAQPMPATITLAGNVPLRPFALSSDGDDDDRASSESASSDASLSRTRLSAAFPRKHFPPMPHPRMDMSRPPPPAPSTLFDSDDQEDETRLDQSRDSIAQHLRLRNPALYNRMVLRQQHVQSASVPSTRDQSPNKGAFGSRVQDATRQSRVAAQESRNDDLDGPAARASRLSQPTSATEHILMPPMPPVLRQSAASSEREVISRAEMLARNQRLYAKLPEVVERKRQEEIARQRMDRLKKLREDDKARRQAKSSARR